MESQIQECQAAGKIILLSLGGAGGGGQFASAEEASEFGTLIWNLFLGGSSDTRPFGDAVLDGIDLDIEGGGTLYFDSLVSSIQSAAEGYSKKMYVSAAPQCPYPDAYMVSALCKLRGSNDILNGFNRARSSIPLRLTSFGLNSTTMIAVGSSSTFSLPVILPIIFLYL